MERTYSVFAPREPTPPCRHENVIVTRTSHDAQDQVWCADCGAELPDAAMLARAANAPSLTPAMTDPIPGRCASCRWWSAITSRDADMLASHSEQFVVRDPATYEPVIPQPFHVAFCMSPKLRTNERPTEDGAASVDASNYYARLVTGPHFGCVNWEAKP